MLVLNKEDMMKTLTLSQIMDEIEKAYLFCGNGEYYMPDRLSFTYKENNLLYMPCFTNSGFSTKYLAVNPTNSQRGLPYINGLILYHDVKTGEILSIMDGRTMTALRTGAIGGVGTRWFSKKDAVFCKYFLHKVAS